MRRALAGAVLAIALTTAARANSISSVVVQKNGDVLFSDYVRDKIWRVDPAGRLSVALSNRHTHHLVVDTHGTVYGEHRSPRGTEVTIWRLEADGKWDEVFRPVRRGGTASYRGTVFTIDSAGNLVYLRDCQLVRLTDDGGLAPIAGRRCSDNAWTNDTLRYGHLHGSLAWGPGGALYFSDSRTIRRVAPDGLVTTLAGKPTTLFADPQPGEERFDPLMGLAVDERGTVYAADRARRVVLRFSPDGKPAVLAQLGTFWSPTGLAASGGDVYLLATLRFSTPAFMAGVFGIPTLRKISADGRVQTVASVKGR